MLKPVYGPANPFLLLHLHHRPSSLGLVLFCPSQAVLIQLYEMLFLTVPGGTASLLRGLFIGSPGMNIRGFVKGGGIRKGTGGVRSSCWADVESPAVVFCTSSFQYFGLCEDQFGLQPAEGRGWKFFVGLHYFHEPKWHFELIYITLYTHRYCNKNDLLGTNW